MIKIFPSTATVFNTLGYGVLKDNKTAPLITEELNGPYILELEYALNGYLSEYLIEGNIIYCKNQPFRISTIEKNIDKIKVLAKHIFFDLSFNFLEDVAPTELNAQQALAWILDRTVENNNFNVNGDCFKISSSRYVKKNPIDAIYNDDNCILKKYGGELEFNNYNVYVHNKRGTDKGYEIRYEKNLIGIVVNLDFSTVATRIMPQGKDGLLIDSKYVDSPIIGNYFTPIYKKMEFPNIGVDENTTEAEAKQQLIDECNALYSAGIDKPQASIKIDFIELSKCDEYKSYSNLESCELGDTVSVIIPFFNLNLNSRVVKTIYNYDLGRYTYLELGTITPNIASNQSKNNIEIANNLESNLSIAREEAKSLINHPFNGNFLIDYTTGTVYFMDTNDPATATNVWKWSLGGLGFSSTGINGNYIIAILQNGHINADFITTGVLDVSLITGQSINLMSNQLTINSPNFSVDSNGNINSKSGIIAGYHITENELYAEMFAKYNYTQADQTRVIAIRRGEITPTQEDYDKYDFNNDGEIDLLDLLRLTKLINYGITTTNPLKIVMSTGNELLDNAFKLVDGQGNEFVRIDMQGFAVKDNYLRSPYIAGDTFLIGDDVDETYAYVASGHITSSSTALTVSIPISGGIDADNVSVVNVIAKARGINGYLDNNSNFRDFTSWCSANIVGDSINLRIKKTSGSFSNVSNNTPIVLIGFFEFLFS